MRIYRSLIWTPIAVGLILNAISIVSVICRVGEIEIYGIPLLVIEFYRSIIIQVKNIIEGVFWFSLQPVTYDALIIASILIVTTIRISNIFNRSKMEYIKSRKSGIAADKRSSGLGARLPSDMRSDIDRYRYKTNIINAGTISLLCVLILILRSIYLFSVDGAMTLDADTYLLLIITFIFLAIFAPLFVIVGIILDASIYKPAVTRKQGVLYYFQGYAILIAIVIINVIMALIVLFMSFISQI